MVWGQKMSDWNDMPENELIELTRDTTPATRGKALETLGVRYASRSDYRTAKTFLEQAVVVNDQAGDLEWSSTSRQILGRVLFELGRYDDAIRWLSEAITGFQNLLWDRVVAETLHSRALAYRANCDIQEALADFDAAFAGLLEKNKPVDAVEALTHKAELETYLGWYGLAHDTLGRAVEVLRTQPVFDTRTTLHTLRIKCATMTGRDATDDIEQAQAVVKFAKQEGLDLELASWTTRWFLAQHRIAEAEEALSWMSEMPESHAKLQRLETLTALLSQETGSSFSLEALQDAYLIATSYKDSVWLPTTAKLLALAYADSDPEHALRILDDTLDAVHDAPDLPEIFDLQLLQVEIDVTMGNWDRFVDFLPTHPVPFDDRFVESFGRLLMLATRYAVHTDAPEGEVIQRLKAATAQTWVLPDEYQPSTLAGLVPRASHVLIPVPENVRQFGFTQAKDVGHFQTGNTMDTLGEIPLGHPVFHMDLAFLKPVSFEKVSIGS